MYVRAVCTGFWFLSLLRYEVGSKYQNNLFSCVLPYLLHNHNFQNFHFQKCATGPRCAEEAARTSGNENSGNYDYVGNRVGHTRRDYFGILNLPRTSTEREIKIRYRQLARTYHPDKYNSTTNKMSKSEAQEHFKLLNNAYEFLRT